MNSKFVYDFGGNKTDGGADLRNLLGGKGANMAEMSNLDIPVPPGFTITTEVCTHFMNNGGGYPDGLESQVSQSVKRLEDEIECTGDSTVLVSATTIDAALELDLRTGELVSSSWPRRP